MDLDTSAAQIINSTYSMTYIFIIEDSANWHSACNDYSMNNTMFTTY